MTQSSPDGTAPLCFGPTDGSSLEGDQRHIGAFFRSAEERQRLLLPFIREGFEHREKAFPHGTRPRMKRAFSCRRASERARCAKKAP